MQAYTHTTFGQAKARLAGLLGDPTKTFYTDEELGRYIAEALRFWGLTAQYWRQGTTLTLVPNQAFYDIQQLVDPLMTLGSMYQPHTFRVTDRELINDLNWTLMEPQITDWNAGWAGSEQFEFDTIVELLEKSREDILRQTACIVTEAQFPVIPGEQRVMMAETDQDVSVGTILRASFQPAESPHIYPLYAIDYYSAQSTVDTATWPAVGRPKAYTLNNAPLHCMDLWPKPQEGGILRVYSQRINIPRDLIPQSAPTFLSIPNDAAWIVKYRMLDDLVGSDGIGKAPELAEYARQRWQQGVDILSLYGSFIWAELGGRRLTISSQFQLDAQRPMWQSTIGTPRSIQQLSWNLISVYPVPDQEYIVSLDAVVSAPIPMNDEDYLNIGPQYIQAIYDYAQHLAMMKIQGAEFSATFSLYQDCVKAAIEHLGNIAGSAPNFRHQLLQAKADRLMRPLRRAQLVDETRQIVGGV